ncbi:MAG: hypothetical protein PUB85_02335 [Clostridia bacterium]|nr:hypothetical protein [Clostridia bacterium]
MKNIKDKSNIIEQMVDGIMGNKKENPSQKEMDLRKRLAGRATEYLMFMDEEEYESTVSEDEIFRFIQNGVLFEYDKSFDVLIIKNDVGVYKQIEKADFRLNNFEDDGEYMRAIFLGQGCWERLEEISKEKAIEILKSWKVEQ